jgi:superoxide dismutase, Fe-Mn family
MPFKFALPPLGYAYDALEPHFDARTMEIHHSKHHQAYTDNLNAALEKHPPLHGKSDEELLRDIQSVPQDIRVAVQNHGGGYHNHDLFWKVIAPGGARSPSAGLAKAIDGAFGTLDAFKTQLSDAAAKRFGSGWGWLSVGKGGELKVHSTANQDSPLMEGLTPVLGVDVWEHAYYLKYQNRRPEYLKAFWEVVNWDEVARRWEAAQKR